MRCAPACLLCCNAKPYAVNRLLIFGVGLLIGAIGVGVAMLTLNTTPLVVTAAIRDCPPALAPTVCPAMESVVAATAPTSDHALAVIDDAMVSESPSTAAPVLPPNAASDSPAPPSSAGENALLIPVANITSSQLRDTFNDARGSDRIHDAIDIMAAKGTPVLAAVDGKVVKLFTSVPGGLTVYQFDGGERHAYYYAHLDGYAPGLAEGQFLKRGDVLGFVGYSGNASPNAPHLHFAIFELGPEKKWWQGTAINPYPLLVSGRSP